MTRELRRRSIEIVRRACHAYECTQLYAIPYVDLHVYDRCFLVLVDSIDAQPAHCLRHGLREQVVGKKKKVNKFRDLQKLKSPVLTRVLPVS